MIAFIIAIVLEVVFALLFKRFSSQKTRLMFLIFAIIVIFIIMAIIAIPTVSEWIPLSGFLAMATMLNWIEFLPHLLFILAYFTSGFSAGVGILQILFRFRQDIKTMDFNLKQKKTYEGIIYMMEIYIHVVIVAAMVHFLLDIFGIIHAEPELSLVLELIMGFPLTWEILGITVAGIKYWRTRTFNLNYTCQVDPRYSNPEKINLHKILTIFAVGLSIWIFIVMEFSVFPYPGITLFYLFQLLGLMVFMLGKRVQDHLKGLLAL